jgi:hypothetical protein
MKSTGIITYVIAYLKVPSHLIRSASKWYDWIGRNEYKDRGWYTDFKCRLYFLFYR